MSRHFDRQIDSLKQRILFVGSIVEQSLERAVTALFEGDSRKASEVIESDHRIDMLEVEVEEECLKLLALYQPVAADLRFVITIMKINNDLERIGDLAKNVAKQVRHLTQDHPVLIPNEMRRMADIARSMCKRALDALVERDVRLAQSVRSDDDQVDDICKSIRELVVGQIQGSPDCAGTWIRINDACKHIERIADMATNIAEDVIYLVDGEIVRHGGDLPLDAAAPTSP